MIKARRTPVAVARAVAVLARVQQTAVKAKGLIRMLEELVLVRRKTRTNLEILRFLLA
jgi:hypothetical protein